MASGGGGEDGSGGSGGSDGSGSTVLSWFVRPLLSIVWPLATLWSDYALNQAVSRLSVIGITLR